MNSFDSPSEPIEQAKTIPSTWYYDSSVFEHEKRTIFEHNWIFVAHKNRITQSSGFLKTMIGDEPILVIEQESGVIKTFIDVCKHRGGPLCLRKGSRSMLQCQYHGWTYTSDGKLRGVPEFDKVELFNKQDFGLTEIETVLFSDLVFVRLKQTENSNDIQKTLTEIQREIHPIQVENYTFHSRVTYAVACNWKIYIDNYLEGYHIPHVHPELNKILDYRNYKTKLSDWHSLQYSNFKEDASLYGNPDQQAFYYFIYPNCMLNILPGRLQTNSIEPISPESCLVHFDYYYDINQYDDQKIKEDQEFSEFVQKEDEEICEAVQKRLKSSFYNQGRFSVKCEQGVWHFQQLIKNSLK